ncbi:MFS transporter [Geomonas sp. Red69]|uniref:MFS transporter n=1 Tax=Geomonas diazotrophica TaxID=2843197 RepID=A0ABX8JQQ6_9BACT|nr:MULTISPECIES: MFS transporter [Geomonas]MBU5637085.1 MFS transporter [Geomonas diazotrophica]QWV99386.1 MFS transporter [Geomonas nitrogeniifigens]QXE88562.1 MFS transporter [Geomonas nitrogeniifigens]
MKGVLGKLDAGLLSSEQRPMLRFLVVLTAASTIGLQGYTILFNNFAAEMVHLNGSQVGVTQSVREIPGLLSLLVVFVLLLVREHKLAALSVMLLGLGTGITALFPSYGWVIFTTVVMSFGFHYYESTNQSLTLQYFSTAVSPLIFGRLRALAAVSSVVAGIIVYCLSGVAHYREMYLTIGALVLAAGIWGLFQNPTHAGIVPQRKKMILRRRYSLFYLLTLLSGARRQIFVVFSILLLVQVFHFTVREMTILFIVNNVVAYILNSLIGKAINHFGERTISSIEYSGVIVIFLVYAFTTSKNLVMLMYILDNILYNFEVAIRTYFQKVADPADIASSMSVGFTINHIAAVFLPALGGYFWMMDYRIPFIAGTVLGVISLIAAQWMRVPDKAPEAALIAEAK